jgi:hypothetical protein
MCGAPENPIKKAASLSGLVLDFCPLERGYGPTISAWATGVSPKLGR